ncbi:MAG: pyridoxamine 5'-phosphate oxidase family protein [Actinomyces sp.]|nr:MAG: pyridoxamine 5'-phosphate oxidase family protein [Actinomyces sp.]
MEHTDLYAGLEALTTAECWDELRRGQVGRLAVSIAGQPDIFPVNYAVDDETIVIRTAPGTKLAAAILGRGVAFEIDELDPEARLGWSVVVKGEATELRDLDEIVAAGDLGIETWAEGDRQRFLRIVPSSVTGRRIPPH